jgi:hypothetical protein
MCVTVLCSNIHNVMTKNANLRSFHDVREQLLSEYLGECLRLKQAGASSSLLVTEDEIYCHASVQKIFYWAE